MLPKMGVSVINRRLKFTYVLFQLNEISSFHSRHTRSPFLINRTTVFVRKYEVDTALGVKMERALLALKVG